VQDAVPLNQTALVTSSRPHRRRERTVTAMGLGLSGLIMAAVLIGQWSGAAPERHGIEAAAMLLMVSVFLGCATILLARRPDHSVSWLMALPILFMVLDLVASVAAPRVGEDARLWLEWVAAASWAVTFPTLIIFLPLVFPTGLPPSPRWRWVVPAGVAAVGGLTYGNAVSPDLLDGTVNPAAVGGSAGPIVLAAGGVLFLVSGLAALASAILRFRSATGIERLQLRWFVRGAAVVPVAVLAAGVLETSSYEYLRIPVFGAGMIVLPLAVTAAILRYRLYDIDRIVSRVVTYALVTVLLVVVYAGIVLVTTSLLSARSNPPDAVIAAATLMVAAAFRPVRTRIQALVDRRFNRTRHDNTRHLGRFMEQARDELDAADLADQLRSTVHAALAPVHVSVWMSARSPEPQSRVRDRSRQRGRDATK